MILESFYLDCLSHASYLVADETAGVALVIDPQRDVDVYLEAAERLGVEIRHVALTHFHADFVAGHLELRERAGATIHLGEAASTEFESSPLTEGRSLVLGPDVRLVPLATPGHTPEGVSLVLFSAASGEEPVAVFTGDTLFVGDVGRPDLMASVGVTAEDLAARLHDSLHSKLLALPDETVVYPAHGAGSMCGKSLGSERSTTIGAQRAGNPALQPMSRAEFVRVVTSDLPAAPAYFAHDAVMNRLERPTLDTVLDRALSPLDLEAALTLASGGLTLLDVRPAAEFAAGHLAGSLNIGLDGRFASWAGSLLDPFASIVLIASAGSEVEAARRLGRVGIDNVAGYLDGGIASVEQPEVIRSTRRIETESLREEMDSAARPVVVDVRTSIEWSAGHMEESLNLPLAELSERLDELPTGVPIRVLCRSGYRSSIAASILLAAGMTDVADVIGGWVALNPQPQTCQQA